MINRGQGSKAEPINVVGSSIFGRYPTISIEKTYNMMISDQWLVPYAGYKLAVDQVDFGDASEGRGIHTSIKFNKLVVVISNRVYLVDIDFDQLAQRTTGANAVFIGNLQTTTGPVYISENNKPQICISDNQALYIYEGGSVIEAITGLDFVPGYLDFHDTYFLCAARGTSTWRLSDQNEGGIGHWPNDSAHVGTFETKPDNVQAVVRFPSKGNMIFVIGSTVTESWYDVGSALFPYQRSSSYNIDYGCLNPDTIASLDQYVVWLAINEKSGPLIIYSDGASPTPITTDGIDYLLSNLQDPKDSQGFIFRQDGHVIYHINFYTDNLSLFYDFKTQKFFHASDENYSYFIASEVSFYNNQYYFITKNNGNLYAFDTIFTTYDDKEIPRIRTCNNVRLPTQDYFIANDVGFTIETGNTNYLVQDLGPISDRSFYLITQDDEFLVTEDEDFLVAQQLSVSVPSENIVNVVPRVDLCISIDGGQTFGSYVSYELNPIGRRKNKLIWWGLGACNTLVCQFRFQGIGRFVVNDGIVNIRQ